jgi:hypothetical protein
VAVALLAGAAARRLRRSERREEDNSPFSSRLSPRLAASAAAAAASQLPAKLAVLEAQQREQAAALSLASKRLDKLATRARAAAGDARQEVRALSGASALHAAALDALSSDVQALVKRADDAQALLSALQGVAAKQFDVTARALADVRARAERAERRAAAGPAAEVEERQRRLRRAAAAANAASAASAGEFAAVLGNKGAGAAEDGNGGDPWRS